MADTEKPTEEAARPANQQLAMPRAPLRGGAAVVAIIPTDLEQVWRIATMAVSGAMAPDSLLKEKGGAWKPLNDAISACAIAIMAGAEMGLTPLASLRSYAVVNGRPTLWGDGIKAVVRQSGLCEYIKTGSDDAKGWCESKRKDTGEVVRKEFTLVQAKKAGLTSKKGPWQDYPDQMMERRATFRCLNDLYADVLAGIVSAEEASDYTEFSNDAPTRLTPPPEPPQEPVIEPTPQSAQPTPPPEPTTITGTAEPVKFDPEVFLTELEETLSHARDPGELYELFDAADVQTKLTGNDDALGRAFAIKRATLGDEARDEGDDLTPPDEPTPRDENTNDIFGGAK